MSRAIRLLGAGDLDAALRLSAIAGWNQTRADWARVLAMEPEGCFCVENAGRVIATATVVRFGDLAWIGMVLTDPEHRGRGHARALMERSIDYGRERGAAWMKLDATDMGRPLYLSLGFADERPIERWGVEASRGPGGEPCGPYVADAELDLEAFGADRGRMLSALAGEAASIPGEGFAMGRDGSRAAYFGPCVARSPEAAGRLLGWFLERRRGRPVYWDILPDNVAAVALAREHGFAPLRRLVRQALPMRTPPSAFSENIGLVFGIAGFEYG
jgi:GNAT superfamily N-acetyltransferase